MQPHRGIAGTLVPTGYFESQFAADSRDLGLPSPGAHAARSFAGVWRRAAATLGPATGLRALYDLLAEPLFNALGFRSRTVYFFRHEATIELTTPGGRTVAAIVLPWAASPASAWREVHRQAQATAAEWVFVLAPPFLSLIPSSTLAARRRLDFTLPAIVDEGAASPFWLLAGAHAFEASPPARDGGEAVLTRIVRRASAFHDRVRRDLQIGVLDALGALRKGTLDEPGPNRAKRAARPGEDSGDQALVLVYRILFLLFAESRNLVPISHPIYGRSYSVGALARDVLEGSSLGCWEGLGAMSRLARYGCRSPSLIVAPFGGRLFERASARSLEEMPRRGRAKRTEVRDSSMAAALVALSSRRGKAGRETINYHDLGVEELGAVYERLLDPPARDASDAVDRTDDSRRVRKLTGTFYTPQALADFIVRRTLAPLVRGASADAILALRVLDPAMGSGACLIAACRYLATAYEHAVIDEGRASPAEFDERRRADVRRLIGERCLAGVDRNPTAVELARLSLWLTTLAHGKPLGFLDHRLRVGDSLIGARPEDISRLSTPGRSGTRTLPLFDALTVEHSVGRIARSLTSLLNTRDDSIDAVRAKARAWRDMSSTSSALEPWRRALSFWCARWFWPGPPADRPSPAEARAVIAALIGGDTTLPPARVEARIATGLEAARKNVVFHWPIEFPDVFYPASGENDTSPGFDAVIGNPPWEMLRRDDGREEKDARALLSYVRESGLYPSCQHGHLNLYQAFLDRALSLVRPGGRIGMVFPWGLASDDGAAPLRRRLLDSTEINSLVGLDNAEGLFPIHRGIRFVVATATAGQPTREIRARFGVTSARELEQLPECDDPLASSYPVRLTRHALERLSGPLLRIPDVRHAADLALATRLSSQFAPLGDPAGWNVSFGREANATEAAPWIGTRGLIVAEGKHISPFVVRPDESRRIDRSAAERLTTSFSFDRSRLAYRDVSGVGNALTLIAAVVPSGIVTTHTLLCLRSSVPLERQHFLAAVFNSWVMNSLVRLLMGSHVTTSLVESLPAPLWTGSRQDRWIAAAAARLANGAADEVLLARLQSAVARRSGLTSEEFRRVLQTFPLVPDSLKARALDDFCRHNADA